MSIEEQQLIKKKDDLFQKEKQKFECKAEEIDKNREEWLDELMERRNGGCLIKFGNRRNGFINEDFKFGKNKDRAD